MNAGRDVDELISRWLSEEATERAPDRVLDLAGRTIDRTKQRRFSAAWKEPTMSSTARLLAMAAALIVAVAGAAWIGRATAQVGVPPPVSSPAPSPSARPSPSSSAAAVTLATYRAARDAYCTPANTQLIALNGQAAKFDPTKSDADRAALVGVLEQIVALGADEVQHLAAIQAPPEIAAEQVADVEHHRESQALLNQSLTLLRGGKVSEANALGDATTPLSSLEEAFEAKYRLAGCP
jgi:hypothetical protein